MPLSGLKVLDFTTLLPGPYATQLLADMGAEVTRVESPTRPDLLKFVQPQIDGQSAAHLAINRNKKAIAVDLKSPEGIELVNKLVADADILIEGFRPGVMQRLGLGYDDLASLNSRLIYCSITGFGQTGELAKRAGHDINYLALSGLASYAGTQQTGPTLSSFQIADIAGGSHHAVMAVLAAVIERYSSDKGQYLDISMTDCALALNTINGANHLAGAAAPTLGEDMLAGGSFYGYYQTSDERYLSVGSLEPQFFTQLLSALQLTAYIDNPMLALEQPQQLTHEIAETIASQSLEHWQSVFTALDCCVEPVLHLNEAVAQAWVAERNMLVEVALAENTKVTQLASATPFKRAEHQAGRALGADTHAVLRQYGYTNDQIEILTEKGVVL